MRFNFEIEDFADSFGVKSETFSSSLVKEIKALDATGVSAYGLNLIGAMKGKIENNHIVITGEGLFNSIYYGIYHLNKPFEPSNVTGNTFSVSNTNGKAYGITGREGNCRLLCFDPSDDTYELGDEIVDSDGTPMWQCHDVDITPEGVLYAGENDHPYRSSYLWEIAL